jgi:chromosome segregation ATPase
MAAKNPLKTLREAIKNPFETVLEPEHVKKAVTDELSQDWKIAISQMLDLKKPQESHRGSQGKIAGDLEEGQEVSLAKAKELKKRIEPGINYVSDILHSSERHAQKENSELRQAISEIRTEISKIAQASSELRENFKDVTNDTMHIPVNVGKYHVNFFEWVLATLRDARVRIESSNNWLSAVKGKSGKKGYWDAAKQHGTSFTLSGERVVAQQVG